MAAAQQERNTVAELQVELVGFKDRIRVAEAELAKNAPVIAQLTHSNQTMVNSVCKHGNTAMMRSNTAYGRVLAACGCYRSVLYDQPSPLPPPTNIAMAEFR